MTARTHTLSNLPSDPEELSLVDWIFYYPVLPVAAILLEFLTPYLISNGYLPGIVRWFSDLLVLAMAAIVLLRMFVFDQIPPVVILMLSVTVIGAVVAVHEGQQLGAILWGWWLFFRYPIVGLYTYLQPHWPKHTASWIVRLTYGLLALQVIIQIVQFLLGEPPGDHLAGTFGRFGTAHLVMTNLFAVCMALAAWLVTGRWRALAWTLLLSAISSALGEMKIFPVLVVAIASIAMVLHMARGGKLRSLFIYTLIFAVVISAFVGLYNTVVAERMGTPRLEEYLSVDNSDSYLSWTSCDLEYGECYIGRTVAVQYGWQSIQRDPTTLLFGMGIGARTESVSLGIVGTALRDGYFGLTTGSSLLILMQEQGMFGLTVLALLFLSLAWLLFDNARLARVSDLAIVSLALFLFSCTWPIWFFYGDLWNSPMALAYWTILGFALQMRSLQSSEQTYEG